MKTPKNFKCKRCGSCCMVSPFLTDNDIKRIKKVGYDEDFFVMRLKGKKFMKLFNKKLINNGCIFLETKNKITSCKIYRSRPETCRNYPTEIRDNGDCRPSYINHLVNNI